MKRRSLLISLGLATLAVAASGTITFAAASSRSPMRAATAMGMRAGEMRCSPEGLTSDDLAPCRGPQGTRQAGGNPSQGQAGGNQPASDLRQEQLRERAGSGECTCDEGNCQYREQNRTENCTCQGNATEGQGLRAGSGADGQTATGQGQRAPAESSGRNWRGQDGQGSRLPMGNSSMMQGKGGRT